MDRELLSIHLSGIIASARDGLIKTESSLRKEGIGSKVNPVYTFLVIVLRERTKNLVWSYVSHLQKRK